MLKIKQIRTSTAYLPMALNLFLSLFGSFYLTLVFVEFEDFMAALSDYV